MCVASSDEVAELAETYAFAASESGVEVSSEVAKAEMCAAE
jgi:hypothetical protein